MISKERKDQALYEYAKKASKLYDYETDAEKIERLTIENLELQNMQLKRATPFAIIGFVIGAIASGAAVWALMKQSCS